MANVWEINTLFVYRILEHDMNVQCQCTLCIIHKHVESPISDILMCRAYSCYGIQSILTCKQREFSPEAACEVRRPRSQKNLGNVVCTTTENTRNFLTMVLCKVKCFINVILSCVHTELAQIGSRSWTLLPANVHFEKVNN